MASGYETHDCGAEPDGSWGNPSPADNALAAVAAVLVFALIWGPTLWWLASMLIRPLSG
jgi:hypothetical protein